MEGGGTLAAAFLAAGLVDKLVLHLAPLLLGATGMPVLAGELAGTLTQAPRLHLDRVTQLGPDVELVLYPDQEPA